MTSRLLLAALLPFALAATTSCAATTAASEAPRADVTPAQNPAKAASALADRLLGARASEFEFVVRPATAPRRRTVEIAAAPAGRIRITGDDAVTLAAGLNLYLKRVAGCHVSWCHDRITLPAPLPAPATPLSLSTGERHGAAFNYCTFNYTMAWWDAERWEREIDLLALQGFDEPLAILGTEAVWMNVLKRFGYTDDEARATLCGPAYTAWWLMGNIEGVGGPVSDATIASRVALQRRILARIRELGMRPVFQGFVGLVPASLAAKHPSAKLIPQGQWCGMPRPPVLHPDDPLFDKLAKAWYEELEKLYGRADLFAGDLFHEGGNSKGVNVSAMATRVQRLMMEHRPESVWSLQGWSGNPGPALLKGLNPANTEVVELCNEFFRNWQSSKGFGGKPWIFGTIIQYGGNVGLHGRLPAIERHLAAARASANPPAGIGYIWESTGVNPVVADLLADIRWNPGRTNLDTWVGDYGVRRYGADTPGVRKAWSLLLKSAYGDYAGHRRPTESVFCARPGPAVTKASPFAASVEVQYDLRDLRDAVALLLAEAPRCRAAATYRHDLVDFTRQYLAGCALTVYRESLAAHQRGDAAAHDRAAGEFLAMIDAQDELLGAEELFLLGRWLKSARAVAPAGEADAYEEQARALITTWYPDRRPAGLADYAWREWNGLLRTYYKPRWQAWFAHRAARLAAGAGNPAVPAPDWAALETAWTKRRLASDPYPEKPVGDPVALAARILERWGRLPDDRARYTPPAPAKAAPTESAADAR